MDPLFDPHHRFEDNSLLDSQRRFGDARWTANVRSLLRTLARQSTTLVPFEEVRSRLGSASTIARGTQIIPLDAIVGSLDRYRDFTREFLPRYEDLRGRWEQLDQATMRQETIAPIDVYKLGEVYFVRDGNHRVSVARFIGAANTEAIVTAVPRRAPRVHDM